MPTINKTPENNIRKLHPADVKKYGSGKYTIEVKYFKDVPTKLEERHGHMREVSKEIFDPIGQRIGDASFNIAIAHITTILITCWRDHGYDRPQNSNPAIGTIARLIYDEYGDLCFGSITKAFENYATDKFQLEIDMKTYGKLMNTRQICMLLNAQRKVREDWYKKLKRRKWRGHY